MDIRVTLKFLPHDIGHDPLKVQLLPAEDAFQLDDTVFHVSNRREAILPICVPADRQKDLLFKADRPVRRVLLGGSDLPFTAIDGGITVSLPPLSAESVRTADLHTLIDLPGVRLRVEQADPLRRSGAYAEGSFPHIAHRAAVTVEFALLQAIRHLGLDRSIGMGPFGPILLMGFDTNNPCGHTDFPPHVHIHMARPAFGAQIGHYYFGDDGLFSHNVVCERRTTAPERVFGRGQVHRQCDPNGNILFEISITQDGWLRLAVDEGGAVTIRPVAQGFAEGAIVESDACSMLVEAAPDYEKGTITVCIDKVSKVYRFDTDSGFLI